MQQLTTDIFEELLVEHDVKRCNTCKKEIEPTESNYKLFDGKIICQSCIVRPSETDRYEQAKTAHPFWRIKRDNHH